MVIDLYGPTFFYYTWKVWEVNFVSSSISGFKLVSSEYLLKFLPKTVEEFYRETQEVLNLLYGWKLWFAFWLQYTLLQPLLASLLYPAMNENSVKMVEITGGTKLCQKRLYDYFAVFVDSMRLWTHFQSSGIKARFLRVCFCSHYWLPTCHLVPWDCFHQNLAFCWSLALFRLALLQKVHKIQFRSLWQCRKAG